MCDKRPYWHEAMTEGAFKKLLEDRPHMTWGDVLKEYQQPDWCNYPDALQGVMGCWSLLDYRIDSVADCHDCECIKADCGSG